MLIAQRRLEEIYVELDGVVANSQSAAAATLRTYVNQVNVLRKHLVQMRRVEDPFLLLPPTAARGQRAGDAPTERQL